MSKSPLWWLLKEPLIHFCLIGSLIFVLYDLVDGKQVRTDNLIVVPSERIAQLKVQFEATWNRLPGGTELDHLIEGHIREEVYYRDALTLGLDRNDAVVRRRMHQKMDFLIDTGSYLEEPSPGELEAYFVANRQTYHHAARLAIEQIYLGETADADKISQAFAALNTAQKTGTETPGEPSFLPHQLGLSTLDVIDSVFGPGFSAQLVELPQQKWLGPVSSSFGIHLVRILNRLPERVPTLGDIETVVRKDWRAAKAKAVRDNDYAQRRSHYVVEIERVDGATAKQAP